MSRTSLIAATLIAIAAPVVAQTERDLDSHEHGSAALNIALDEGAVFIELESPWDNIVGFEHAPNTTEQEKLVDDALALLNNPDKLFSFTGTSCTIAQTSLESGLGADKHHDEHSDEHKHSDEHHDDEHSDDEHSDEHHDDEHHDDEHHDDEHKDEHHDDEHSGEHKHSDEYKHDEETHSAVLLVAEFNCEDITKLSSIDVSLLSIWSGFEDLDVQLIGPAGQASIELSQSQTSVDTKQVQ